MGVILGHMFPVFLNLRGGKGVATTIGVILVLAPRPALYGLVTWAVLVLFTRMVSVGSMGFAVMFALSHFFGHPDPFSRPSLGLSLLVLLIALLVIVRHAGNIGRIINGTEAQVRLPWTPKAK